MSIWKDTTSYQRRERGVIEPNTWSIESIGLIVHRYLGLPGWYMTARQDDNECRELESEKLEDAQKEALRLLHEMRKERLREIEQIVG
jgi:hypothetical protein